MSIKLEAGSLEFMKTANVVAELFEMINSMQPDALSSKNQPLLEGPMGDAFKRQFGQAIHKAAIGATGGVRNLGVMAGKLQKNLRNMPPPQSEQFVKSFNKISAVVLQKFPALQADITSLRNVAQQDAKSENYVLQMLSAMAGLQGGAGGEAAAREILKLAINPYQHPAPDEEGESTKPRRGGTDRSLSDSIFTRLKANLVQTANLSLSSLGSSRGDTNARIRVTADAIWKEWQAYRTYRSRGNSKEDLVGFVKMVFGDGLVGPIEAMIDNNGVAVDSAPSFSLPGLTSNEPEPEATVQAKAGEPDSKPDAAAKPEDKTQDQNKNTEPKQDTADGKPDDGKPADVKPEDKPLVGAAVLAEEDEIMKKVDLKVSLKNTFAEPRIKKLLASRVAMCKADPSSWGRYAKSLQDIIKKYPQETTGNGAMFGFIEAEEKAAQSEAAGNQQDTPASSTSSDSKTPDTASSTTPEPAESETKAEKPKPQVEPIRGEIKKSMGVLDKAMTHMRRNDSSRPSKEDVRAAVVAMLKDVRSDDGTNDTEKRAIRSTLKSLKASDTFMSHYPEYRKLRLESDDYRLHRMVNVLLENDVTSSNGIDALYTRYFLLEAPQATQLARSLIDKVFVQLAKWTLSLKQQNNIGGFTSDRSSRSNKTDSSTNRPQKDDVPYGRLDARKIKSILDKDKRVGTNAKAAVLDLAQKYPNKKHFYDKLSKADINLPHKVSIDIGDYLRDKSQ